MADTERDDGQAAGVLVAEDLDASVALPDRERAPPVAFLRGLEGLGAHRLLEGEDQSGPDGLHDRGGAAEKLPISSGRSAYRRSSASRRARSMWPSASASITTTSATDSRQGSSLEWCS